MGYLEVGSYLFSVLSAYSVENSFESITHRGAKLGPRIFEDLFQGLFRSKGFPVGTGRCHGIVGIGHGDDLSPKGDLVSLQTVRIS